METTNATIYHYDGATEEHWAEFIARKNAGECLEIDESMFDYWLGVIPPVAMNFTFLDQRISFAFAEGDEPRTLFWRDGERIFCQLMRLFGSTHPLLAPTPH